jgi:hypothetical protein
MFPREEMSSRAATKAMDLSRDFRRGKRMKIPQRLLSAKTKRTGLSLGRRVAEIYFLFCTDID